MTKVGLSSRMMLPASISLDAISPNPFRWTLASVKPTQWAWWFLYSMAWHSLLKPSMVTKTVFTMKKSEKKIALPAVEDWHIVG